MCRREKTLTIKINDYAEFVDETTSDASKHYLALISRLDDLKSHANIPRLLTASVGMLAESGEFAEISKKIIFQGKEWTEEERFHMKRELGDILWYWVQGCKSLGFKPEDVMQENIKKLEKRYPNGFEAHRSEHREVGDI